MPPTLQTSTGTVSFTVLVGYVKDRIAAKLGVEASTVRTCFVTEASIGEYLSQEGVVLRVGSPTPVSSSGGGRWDYRVRRTIYVYVLTACLLDQGGRDDEAFDRHVAREEALIDAIHDTAPLGSAWNLNRIGVTIKWVEGGSEIARQVKSDAGLNVSVLPFLVEYRAPLTVLRD